MRDPAVKALVVAAHTTPTALRAFFAAWHASKRPLQSPFSPGSLQLLFFDPVR